MNRKMMLGVITAAILVLSACSGNAGTNSAGTAEATDTHYPVTIHNFAKAEGATSWEPKDQVFDKAPEKIMANTRPAAEMLLHLGLADKIVGVGASFGAPDEEVQAEYDKLNILGEEYVGKEVTLGTNPDFVFGRGGLFANEDWGVGTIDDLNGMNIRTYALESSIDGGTYDSVYKDIEHLGQIFNVQEKAQQFIQKLIDREKAITSSLEGIQEEKTFALLFMSDPNELSVYAAHGESFFHDAFKMVKLDNVFKDEAGEVSAEMLIAADPDVLIIPNWDTFDYSSAETLKEGIYANPKLSSMKAIKNKQIFAVDYNYMFGYSYNTIFGMEQLAKEMYPDLFK